MVTDVRAQNLKQSVIKSSSKVAGLLFLIFIPQIVFSIIYIIGIFALTKGQVDNAQLMNDVLGIPYILATIINIAIVYWFRKPHYFIKDITYQRQSMNFLVWLLVTVLILSIGMLVQILEYILIKFGISISATYYETFNDIVYTPYNIIYIGILGPIAEEIIFRGAVLRSFLPYGRNFAIISSSILFGLMHCDSLQFFSAGLLGIVLAIIAINYGMRWTIAIHIFNNLVLATGISLLNEQIQTYFTYLTYLCPLIMIGVTYYYRDQIQQYYQEGRVNYTVFKYWLTSKLMLSWLILTVIATILSCVLV